MSKMQLDGYEIDLVVTGYPGKSVCHGALGWSTIALLRGGGRTALIDVGSFAQRKLVVDRLAVLGLAPADVTHVILTHSHWDHSVNWVMFPRARVTIGGQELDWAVREPVGSGAVPELYVEALESSPQLRRVAAGDEALPGLVAHATPGHTPGSLVFVLSGRSHDIVFSGDAAKNRAELISGEADLTMDAAVSRQSIAAINELWRRRPGSILVPGHDVPMVLEDDRPRYLDRREAAITAWYGDDLESTTRFELTLA